MLWLAISVCLFLSNVRIIPMKLGPEIKVFCKGNLFGDALQTTQREKKKQTTPPLSYDFYQGI